MESPNINAQMQSSIIINLEVSSAINKNIELLDICRLVKSQTFLKTELVYLDNQLFSSRPQHAPCIFFANIPSALLFFLYNKPVCAPYASPCYVFRMINFHKSDSIKQLSPYPLLQMLFLGFFLAKLPPILVSVIE